MKQDGCYKRFPKKGTLVHRSPYTRSTDSCDQQKSFKTPPLLLIIPNRISKEEKIHPSDPSFVLFLHVSCEEISYLMLIHFSRKFALKLRHAIDLSILIHTFSNIVIFVHKDIITLENAYFHETAILLHHIAHVCAISGIS